MHLDRYLCILSAGGSVGRIGGVVRSSLSIERFAIIHSLRQRAGFTEQRSKIKPFRRYKL